MFVSASEALGNVVGVLRNRGGSAMVAYKAHNLVTTFESFDRN